MSAKRFTGKTESDAVMNAAMELGIPSTDLKYTVIDPGSNGFFGLFKKPVIIEIKEEEKENKVYKFIFTYSTVIYFSSSCNLDNWLFYKDYGFRRRKYRPSN